MAQRSFALSELNWLRSCNNDNPVIVIACAGGAGHKKGHIVPNRLTAPKNLWGNVVVVVKDAAADWVEDEASRLAASLAFYTLLSLAPLLMLSIAVAGFFLGAEAASGQIAHKIRGVVGPDASQAIQAVVANASQGWNVASVAGISIALFGASGVFGELQVALNRVWEVEAKPSGAVKSFLRARFFSVTMVMGVTFLLLVSLVISAVLAALTTFFSQHLGFAGLWATVNFLVSLAVTSGLFALIFKWVPDVQVAWRDVWVGGVVTALLFTIGKTLLGWYIGRSAAVSSFGAAGSLVALIVWVYYSAQILFFGAEITQVYARYFGGRVQPSSHAVRVKGRQARIEAKDAVEPAVTEPAVSEPPPAGQP